jgi:hypothetical protein
MHYYDRIYFVAAAMQIIVSIILILDCLLTRRATENVDNKKGKKMNKAIVATAIIVTLASIGIVAYASGGAFKNEQLTREAWRSLEAKDYAITISKAEECITLFEDAALKEQNALEKEGVFVPIGKVNKDEKERIFKRGLLNDVATIWFILGKAHAGNGNKELAEKAFKKTLLFPHGRCYDPSNDSFWAPSDGAKVELKKLSGKSIYD